MMREAPEEGWGEMISEICPGGSGGSLVGGDW